MPNYLNFLRRFFRSTSIEWPIKRSFVYCLYLRIKSPDKLAQIADERKFYSSLLENFKEPLVYDIGANRGEKTQIFLDLGAKVVCVDPEPTCVDFLSRRFAAYGSRVRVVRTALAEAQGDATMFIHSSKSGYNTLEPGWAATVSNSTGKNPDSIQVPTQTFDGLIEKFARPDFAKIDVEGYELNVFSGLHRPIRLLTFEVNLPDFLEKGIACVRKLVAIDPSARFNYFVSCAEGEILPEALTAEPFIGVLEGLREDSVEVVCRMDV
jgi:FkbM family methyltransferase